MGHDTRTAQTRRPWSRAGARAASRPGFSLPELMLVLCVAAMAMGYATPKLRRAQQLLTMRAAKNDLASSVASARAAAVQKGRPGRLTIKGSRMTVSVDTNAARNRMTLIERDLKLTYRVTIQTRNPADSVIPFDSRGFARTASGGTAVYVLSAPGGLVDSVCVSLLGLASKKGCIK